MQPSYAYNNNVIKYPGKEITSMVFGINALVWGVFTIFFCWHIVLAMVYGVMSIGFGIVALVLRNQVYSSNATVFTGKANIGKKLGTAGIICGAVAMVLSIIIIFVIIAVAGSSAVYSILAS